jgi:transposase
MSRYYARSRRGTRAVVREPFRHGGNISIISALTIDGVRCPMMIKGAIDTRVLEAYVEQLLAPELRRGDIVIWDNVPTHLNARIIELIEATGARVQPLPAYSPELNPKEECISKIKTSIRSAKARTELMLRRALCRAIDSVTQEDIRGWFQHAGYALT